MGGDSIEGNSGEIEPTETNDSSETPESSPEVTTSEVETAFDEKSPENTNNEVKADSKESETTNNVSEKSSRNDYYNVGAEKNEAANKETETTAGKNLEAKYDRPTSYRAGVRDQVWENAKDEHGRVRDPVTGKYMSKDQPWQMGHKPGYEFTKHQESAERRQISRKEFLDEHNNPDHYRPELPSSNMSHKGESKTENYYN